jgi:hypothetical protein
VIRDFENNGQWSLPRGVLALFLALCLRCLDGRGARGKTRDELKMAVLKAGLNYPPDDPVFDFIAKQLP